MAELETLNEKEKVSRLIKYWKVSEEIRKPWEDGWQETTDYMLPRMSNFKFNRNERGKRKNKTIYDSTAPLALNTASDGLQGYMTPESSPWYRLLLPFKQLESIAGARRFCQDTEIALYGELARSNFYHMLSEAYPTTIGLGNVTAYQEEDEGNGVIVYTSMHPKEMYIHENKYGVVDTHIRRHFMNLENLIEQFGNKVPEKLRQRAKENPYDDVLVLHFVMPRRKRVPGKLDSKNKPFASYHILESEKVLLRESGYDFDPYTSHRLMKNTDESYGRGWGFIALPDTLRINQIARTLLIGAHKAVNPPVWFPAEQEDYLDLNPGGMNPYWDPRKEIKTIDLLGQYPIARDQEEDIRKAIRDIFMVSFFIALAQLQGVSNRTATEVLEMQGEKAAILSTLTNRIHTEFLTPILIKTWRMAYRAGRMPEIPEALKEYGVRGLKIDFVGPLSQILKQYYAYQGINRTLQQVLPLTADDLFPESKDIIDGDELFLHLLNEGTFPQKAIRDNKAVERIRKARAEQMERQMQLENAERIAKALPGLNQPVQPGSPLEVIGAA